jgi:hypothetical protein
MNGHKGRSRKAEPEPEKPASKPNRIKKYPRTLLNENPLGSMANIAYYYMYDV